MVWKGSKKFGIGQAYGTVEKDGKSLQCKYIVARYQPAGNVAGQYADNVLKSSIKQNECERVPLMLSDVNFDDDNNDNNNEDSFQEEELKIHNAYRKIHGVPPMELNDELSEEAAAYAKELAGKGKLPSSTIKTKGGQGENLYRKCYRPEDSSEDHATDDWYNQICDNEYKRYFEKNNPTDGPQKFTQVIWKASSRLGIGKAESTENGKTCLYVVARYSPSGGRLKDNVLEGTFNQERYCDSINSASPSKSNKKVS